MTAHPDRISGRDDHGNTLGPVVFCVEPGACAGRLNPGQALIPEPLASMVDGHVWPSASPAAVAPWARTVCDHVDYELVWHEEPELFTRRAQVGVPPLEVLWEARRWLADHGLQLGFDVQMEVVDDELALAVYGAGVVGRMDDRAWNTVAGLLTTCCSSFCEPRVDVVRGGALVRPVRPPSAVGARTFAAGVVPAEVSVGGHLHTWWRYPYSGSLRENCPCPAHIAERGRSSVLERGL